MEFIAFQALTLQVLGVIAGAFLLVYVGSERNTLKSFVRVTAMVAMLLCSLLFVCTLLKLFNGQRVPTQQKPYHKLEMDITPGGMQMTPGQKPTGNIQNKNAIPQMPPVLMPNQVQPNQMGNGFNQSQSQKD